MSTLRDLTGQRFGKLVVLARAANRIIGKCKVPCVHWRCICDCGQEVEVFSGNLNSGHTKSCGCHRSSAYNLGGTYWYMLWKNKVKLCTDPATRGYRSYGGRGIKMHPPWLASLKVFHDDVIAEIGEKPAGPGWSLDRINNNGNYEPGNIRWATNLIQSGNRRDNQRITYGDQTEIAAEWERQLGLRPTTLMCWAYRLEEKLGISREAAYHQVLAEFIKRTQPPDTSAISAPSSP